MPVKLFWNCLFYPNSLRHLDGSSRVITQKRGAVRKPWGPGLGPLMLSLSELSIFLRCSAFSSVKQTVVCCCFHLERAWPLTPYKSFLWPRIAWPLPRRCWLKKSSWGNVQGNISRWPRKISIFANQEHRNHVFHNNLFGGALSLNIWVPCLWCDNIHYTMIIETGAECIKRDQKSWEISLGFPFFELLAAWR